MDFNKEFIDAVKKLPEYNCGECPAVCGFFKFILCKKKIKNKGDLNESEGTD